MRRPHANPSQHCEDLRLPEANNQVNLIVISTRSNVLLTFITTKVFFIDTSGALCSRSTGHAIDVEGESLRGFVQF